jgi:hypothetical protein
MAVLHTTKWQPTSNSSVHSRVIPEDLQSQISKQSAKVVDDINCAGRIVKEISSPSVYQRLKDSQHPLEFLINLTWIWSSIKFLGEVILH